MIFSSMLTCTIGSQGRPNKMAAANFLWLHFLNNRSSIQSFFLRSVGNGPLVSQWSYDFGWRKKVTYFNEVEVHLGYRANLQATKELKWTQDLRIPTDRRQTTWLKYQWEIIWNKSIMPRVIHPFRRPHNLFGATQSFLYFNKLSIEISASLIGRLSSVMFSKCLLNGKGLVFDWEKL